MINGSVQPERFVNRFRADHDGFDSPYSTRAPLGLEKVEKVEYNQGKRATELRLIEDPEI